MTAPPQEVEHIAFPNPNTAVFQWNPRGLLSLNRQNKLSSLPFWFPTAAAAGSASNSCPPSTTTTAPSNATTKRFQFRLVLMKGVVRGATEADDSIAVYVEYLPGPEEDDDATVEEGARSRPAPEGDARKSAEVPTLPSSRHPDGCKVVLRLINRADLCNSDRSKDLIEETSGLLNRSDRQIAFRTFLSSQVLHPPLRDEFFTEEGNNMTLQVTVQVQVESITKRLTEAMQNGSSQNAIAGSLWSAVSSWSTTVAAFVQETAEHIAELRPEAHIVPSSGSDTGGGGGSRSSTPSATQQQTSAQHRDLPWSVVPDRWRSGREASWKHFTTEVLLDDENTFLVALKKTLTSDEQLLLTQYGMSHRAVAAVESLFDYDRDVHEGLLTLPALRRMRYQLVPKKVSDLHFWAAYFGKVTALSLCERDEQAKLLLSILNAPPLAAPISSDANRQQQGAGATGGGGVSASLGSLWNSSWKPTTTALSSLLFRSQSGSSSSASMAVPEPVDAADVDAVIADAECCAQTLQEQLEDMKQNSGAKMEEDQTNDQTLHDEMLRTAVSSGRAQLRVVEGFVRRLESHERYLVEQQQQRQKQQQAASQVTTSSDATIPTGDTSASPEEQPQQQRNVRSMLERLNRAHGLLSHQLASADGSATPLASSAAANSKQPTAAAPTPPVKESPAAARTAATPTTTTSPPKEPKPTVNVAEAAVEAATSDANVAATEHEAARHRNRDNTTSQETETRAAREADQKKQNQPPTTASDPHPEPKPDESKTSGKNGGNDDSFDDGFDRLPSIDDLATPSPTAHKTKEKATSSLAPPGTPSQAAVVGSSSSSSKKISGSASKIEFEAMPWELEDD